MEETTPNKYIAAAYKLYIVEKDSRELVETASAEHPFHFISGTGTTLDAFEAHLKDLNTGDTFEFALSPKDAYGEAREDCILDLPRSMFEIDGKFDYRRIFEGNVVPLINADGNRLNGTVVAVRPDTVRIDLNHPLAGKILLFEGEIVDAHPATVKEMEEMANALSNEGCCGHCEGGCGEGGCGGGCGHCG